MGNEYPKTPDSLNVVSSNFDNMKPTDKYNISIDGFNPPKSKFT
jgi:hypothetical protein